jgi:glutaminyl-peptide cyclotransferase
MIKFVLLSAAAVVFASCNQHGENSHPEQSPPSQTPAAKITVPEFDDQKAFSYLKAQTDFGPRNPNSIGHQKCLEYLANELSRYADRVTRQDFIHRGYGGEILKLTNIFGAFNSSAADRILLLAHWDTRPRSDEEKDPAKRSTPILGANDGASGVAVLMEIAGILKQTPPQIGVDILFVDGEDYGTSHDLESYFLGTRYFLKVKSESYRPRFAVLLDMVGYKDLQIPMEQSSSTYAPEIVERIWSTAENLGVTQFVNIPGEQISDDHTPLNEGGLPAVDIIDFQYPYWHTTQDTPDKCSPESLGAVGKVLLHVIYNELPGAGK